ncbi:MAG: pre-peptidase C-terminal domain-containing protein, partial [Acidobacteriota bacterium]
GWTATSATDWLSITAGSSGSGNGTVAFTVAVNASTNSRSGNLTIAGQSFIVTQAGSCPTTAITPGQIISGSLSATDCRTPLRSGQPFVDRYTFNGTEGQAVTILNYAETFDSYLILIGPDGRVLAEDDDGGPGNNAQITANGFFRLPASGTYIIEATSLSSGTIGDYLVYLGLGSANCTYGGSITSPPYAALGATGNVTITTGAGCMWQLVSSVPWFVFGSASSGTGNGTAGFTVLPNAGSSARRGIVMIGATAFAITQNGNPLACPSSPITSGQTINGTLSTGDCPSSFRTSTTFSDHYSFSATAGQRVAVTMTSSAFDAFLYLIGPNGALIGSDDDSGGGNNSRFPSTGFFQIPT